MATVTSIVKLALKDAGIIGGRETPTDDEMQDAFDTLNQMLAMWRTQTLTVYCLKQESIVATGATSYTIGTGGDLNIERPVQVNGVFWRYNSVDRPLKPLHSFEDYQDIGTKNLQGDPYAYCYVPSSTLGVLYAYPIPTSGTLYLTLMQPMPIYTTINDDISLPPEYEGAIRWNLAEMMCATFGMPITPEIDRFARQTKRALKINNTQLKTMRMPDGVLTTTVYNIRTGK